MLMRQLEYFSAVARLGSFRRAAEECCVSQSAVSQQVKALERELGVALTERCGRGFALTPAGKLVAERALQVLELTSEMRLELRELAEGPRRLRVGYLNRYAGWEMPAAVAAFARRHPEVEVTARPADHEALYEGVLSGEFDVLLNDRRRQLSDAFVNVPLFTAYAYVEVSEASELARRESVTIPELAGSTCILVARAACSEAEEAYYRDVLSFPCAFAFADSVEEAHMLVAGNHGFMPLEARERGVRTDGALRRIPLVDARGEQRTHEYFAFWPRARTSPLVEEFADVLRGLFA